MPLDELGPDVAEHAYEFGLAGTRRAMEDEHRDSRHLESSLLTRTVRAYVGLGSNVGDSQQTMARAVRTLDALPGTRVRKVSRLYRTKPVGVRDQPDFLNAVVALDVPAGPDPETGSLALLAALKQLEQAFGRQERRRWGPREIDLDLLLFGRHQIDVERPDGRWLKVPHPEAHERLFVLAPLSDISPGLRPPGWHETVATARETAVSLEGPDAIVDLADWDSTSGTWREAGR